MGQLGKKWGYGRMNRKCPYRHTFCNGINHFFTELYQTSVGKSFGMAAKESKLRQKRYQDELSSNGRGRTFLSSSGGSSSAAKTKNKERLEEEEDYVDQKISPY